MVAMANKHKHSIGERLVRGRTWVQAAFLLVWLDPAALRLHTVCSPVFHCYSCPLATFACPIGVLANFSALHLFPFIVVGMLVIFAGALGSFVCGWACPFGLLQDLIGRIPTPKFRLPAWTGHLRYVVLVVLVLAIPYWFSEEHALFFCRLCPAGALEAALPNVVQVALAGDGIVWPSSVKLAILVVVMAAMFFTWRPWCAVLCPLGAIFGLFNRVSFLFLRFHTDNCEGCGGCSAFCKYGVLPERGFNDSRCIRCLECTRCTAISLNNVMGEAPRTAPATRPNPRRAKTD